MTVTKEAITAAALRLRDETGGFGDEDDRAVAEQMLEAALPFLSSRSAEAGKPVVKGLQWELINGWWVAPTTMNQNYIVRASSATNFKGQWLWGLGVKMYLLEPSLEAAKAAAQADYEARVLSALEVGPVVTANCCHCGRIIDTREISEGGDAFGAEMSDGRWTCSFECNDAVLGLSALSTPADIEPVAWRYKIKGEYGWSDWVVVQEVAFLEEYKRDKPSSIVIEPLYAAPVADRDR